MRRNFLVLIFLGCLFALGGWFVFGRLMLYQMGSSPPNAHINHSWGFETPPNRSMDSESNKSFRAAYAARAAEITAINQALAELSEGTFFHNVPDSMEVGIPVTIESGIAAEDVNTVLNRHGITGEFFTETDIRFDPLGTEIELIAPSDAFRKEAISAGRKTIFTDDEPIWSWQVVPQKAGQHLIVIKVTVQLTSPVTGNVYPKEFITFRQHRLVNVNYAYSFRAFVAQHWEELLTRIIGPGTVFGAIGWWAGNRRQRELEKKRQPVGFIGATLSDIGKRK